ncbi:endonuclease [Pectobacterium phage MA1A]|uniref:Endonuclease I n=1 Tax=Pectobacterium phage PP47 TaxID=1932882 RepID=A0A1P8L680_9CAUD|nr:endonuclease [Pectobacterium phage PP47]APW79758.1 endonuclease I [Pectobacterium phage PP47]QGF19800.1 endonuclease [Pectobacterium phage MA6]QGH45328.1 endonuclease [Pectobacterium phage MA1A]
MANVYAARGVSRVGAFRSGLEDKVSKQLEAKGVKFDYEMWKIPYVIPASNHFYTPDFLLPNGIFVETKGLWDSDDRKKHLLIREQFPMLDIRLVFSSSRTKLYKGSPTSYAEWCEKNSIKFADKLIPVEWLKESRIEVPFDRFKSVKKNKEK